MPSKLLQSGTVLTFDEVENKVKVLPRASILISNDRIEAISENLADLNIPDGTEEVDVTGKIISPGFINTHVHMWQTAYKTLGPDIFVVQYFLWLSQMSPATKAFTPEDLYISALEGYLDGLNGGVTSYIDHASNNWGKDIMRAGYDAAVDSGARTWWCYDVRPGDDFTPGKQWEAYRGIASEHREKNTSVSLGLSFDGIAHAPEEDFKVGMKMIKDLGLEAITTHHIGGPWPVGNNSPKHLVDRGIQDADLPVVYSHAGYLTKEEIGALRDHDHYISITPESEFHHGHGQKTGRFMSDRASLGCDGNWTYSGDILGQARLWLQTVRHTNYLQTLESGHLPNQNPMSVEQAFLLATRQGGRALRRDDIGVLKPGSKADIVVWNGDSPNMLGWRDPIAAILLHANVGDVQHVLVDGQWRKRDFELVMARQLGWREVKERFLDAAKRVQDQLADAKPQVPKNWFGVDLGDVEVATTVVPPQIEL